MMAAVAVEAAAAMEAVPTEEVQQEVQQEAQEEAQQDAQEEEEQVEAGAAEEVLAPTAAAPVAAAPVAAAPVAAATKGVYPRVHRLEAVCCAR